MRRVSILRSFATVVSAIVLIVILAACATDSPGGQADRQDKAAALSVITLHMPRDLWEQTSTGAGHKPIENPQRLTDEPNGMATVELTGAQLVEYLQMLDFNAHGGFMAQDKELAATVYDTLASALDGMQAPPAPGAPAPQVTIDAAAVPKDPAPPK